MRNLVFSCLALLAACGAPTSAPTAPALSITDAWAAPTPGGVNVSAGYMTITNTTDSDDVLLSAASPRAGVVEVHEMTMDGPVMRMRPVEALTIAAGQSVQLASGGAHIMFYDVTTPFVAGEEIALQLTFQNAGEVDVVLPVRAARQTHDSH